MINRHWWVDPSALLLFLILPVFLISASLGGPLMPQFGSFVFLTPQAIYLGAACICILAAGAKLGTAATAGARPTGTVFREREFDLLVKALLLVTLGAYLLMLSPLLVDPGLMLNVLRGEMTASFIAKAAMIRIPGITTLTHLSTIVFCLCSIRFVTWGRTFPSRAVAFGVCILFVLIFIHAFVGSERLVLLQNAIAALVPLLSFYRPLRLVGHIAPFAGLLAVAMIFAIGEYTRSWPYYKEQYDTFAEFAWLRLLAYISGASNTGAGLVETMPPVGFPLFTARWYAKLPFFNSGQGYRDEYFRSFGNVEFNNTSGIFAAIVDYGAVAGLMFLFLFGILLGVIYGYYRRRHPVGMIAYPLFFVGLMDIIQIWYWGEPRFLPQLLGIGLVLIVAVRRQVRIPLAREQRYGNAAG